MKHAPRLADTTTNIDRGILPCTIATSPTPGTARGVRSALSSNSNDQPRSNTHIRLLTAQMHKIADRATPDRSIK